MATKMLPVTQFAKSGLNSDVIPWDLPGDFVTDIKNIRIRGYNLSPFGGYRVWATLPVDFNPGYLMHVGSVSGTFWIIPGEDAVYVYDGASFTDISSTAGYASISNPDYWVGCMLSQIPIINHRNHYPEYWPVQTPGVQLELLPWAAGQTWLDVGESCKIMRSHKQYLFALDLQSGSNEWPDGVRWSAPADIGGVPSSWDPLDTTNVAGITNLGSDGGKIIDGLTLRDAFVVYRESGISIFDYVGGQYIWRIRHLSTTVGLVSPNAIIEVKGKHFFIGDGDILVNDGNTITSLLHNRIRSRFISDYDADNYLNSYVVKNNTISEAWFCIPSAGSTYATIAYVYNWRDDTWSLRELPTLPFANYGPRNSPPLTWDAMTMAWDSMALPWTQSQVTPFDDTIIGITKPTGPGTSGELLEVDIVTGSSEVSYNCTIERVGFALEGLNNVTTITTIYPHIQGTGFVKIQIGSQDYPGAPTRWKPTVDFHPETDRKVDMRTTGELHCFRIYSEDVVTSWDLSGVDIEYVMAGKR